MRYFVENEFYHGTTASIEKIIYTDETLAPVAMVYRVPRKYIVIDKMGEASRLMNFVEAKEHALDILAIESKGEYKVLPSMCHCSM